MHKSLVEIRRESFQLSAVLPHRKRGVDVLSNTATHHSHTTQQLFSSPLLLAVMIFRCQLISAVTSVHTNRKISMHTLTPTCTPHPHIHTHTYINTHTHTCINTHIYINTHTPIRLPIRIRIILLTRSLTLGDQTGWTATRNLHKYYIMITTTTSFTNVITVSGLLHPSKVTKYQPTSFFTSWPHFSRYATIRYRRLGHRCLGPGILRKQNGISSILSYIYFQERKAPLASSFCTDSL